MAIEAVISISKIVSIRPRRQSRFQADRCAPNTLFKGYIHNSLIGLERSALPAGTILPRAVADAEKGKSSTVVAVYITLLWAYHLLGLFAAITDSALDPGSCAGLGFYA